MLPYIVDSLVHDLLHKLANLLPSSSTVRQLVGLAGESEVKRNAEDELQDVLAIIPETITDSVVSATNDLAYRVFISYPAGDIDTSEDEPQKSLPLDQEIKVVQENASNWRRDTVAATRELTPA